MNAALGVLALAMLGVEGVPKPDAPVITYEFRVLDMAGVEWREGVYPSLQPVTRQGAATVWTTSDAVAETLAKLAERVVQAPKLVAHPDVPAHVSTMATRGLVTTLSRHADGPANRATKVAYTPETEKVRDGFATTITGRKLDQGVLAKLVLDDTRVAAVHAVYVNEFQEAKHAGECCEEQRCGLVQAKLEVPELIHEEVAGEWLIPKDGVLLVSLGAHSLADAKGRAVVRERLVLVKADALTTMALAPMTGAAKLKDVLPNPVMPAPAVPTRTLPQGVNSEGTPVPLPPLPPEEPAPTARPDSAEPVATPQSKHNSDPDKPKGEPAPKSKDEGSVPASHQEAKPAAAACAEVPKTLTLSFRIVLPSGVWKALGEGAPVAGLTLPSAKYMHDDVQFFPPGPAFPGANTMAAARRAADAAKKSEGRDPKSWKSAPIPAPVPEAKIPPTDNPQD